MVKNTPSWAVLLFWTLPFPPPFLLRTKHTVQEAPYRFAAAVDETSSIERAERAENTGDKYAENNGIGIIHYNKYTHLL
jgi:hypothetical protein